MADDNTVAFRNEAAAAITKLKWLASEGLKAGIL